MSLYKTFIYRLLVLPLKQCVVECVEARKSTASKRLRGGTTGASDSTVNPLFGAETTRRNDKVGGARQTVANGGNYRTTTEDFYYEYEAEERL